MFIYLFVLTFFSFFPSDQGELSIPSLVVPPFQKVCENYHITDVIISPMSSVHCNTCSSKSTIQKLGFLCGSIATNDEPMLLTIESKCK
jgi:hypothetical protein